MTTFYIILICLLSIIVTNIIYTFALKFFLKSKIGINGINLNKKHFVWTKSFISYLLWAFIGLSFLIYFTLFRFYNQWLNLHNYIESGEIKNPDLNGIYYHSITISKGLLLDMCPFMALALPVSFIFDKSKKFSSYLSPFCIFGGMITLPFISLSEPNVDFNLHYIFIGTSANPLYFMIHWFILVFGILALRRNKHANFFDLIYLHLIAAFYFGYIILVSRLLNVQYNVTGTVEKDWTDPYLGSYYNVSQIMHLSYPWVMIVSYTLSYIFIVGLWMCRVCYLKYWKKIWINKKFKIKFFNKKIIHARS